MLRQILNAVVMLLVLTLITGFIYPLVMTGLAQALYPFQANGSIFTRDGVPVGSNLIGQNFSAPGYFHGRPSAAGQDGYDATASGGSNLGPTNQKLIDTVADNLKKVREENGLDASANVPSDLVLASASGLDPEITPAAAYLQVERIAKVRGLGVDQVHQLVSNHIQERQWGVFGEPRINVLELNLALDSLRP
ncbi:MAG: potassium-transporting ATPase subunit KdpC [Negativicutes bacterium]|nr:potassium-transporting ATPase subunit KdpC [Negativicutes bacterium]